MNTATALPTASQLHHGDALIEISNIPTGSVDLIFADPPYLLSNGGTTCQGGQRVSVNKGRWDRSAGLNEDLQFHQEWLRHCYRVLADTGSLWVSGSYHSIHTCGFAALSLGYHIINEVTWFKPNAAPNLGCRCFTASHETLLWLAKGKGKRYRYTFNYESMRHGDFPRDQLKSPGKQMRSVWSIPTPPRREKFYGKHPTQKPLALLDRIILASSNPGDLVLDPFMGSGTTGVSAIANGRRFIGIEQDSEFFQLASARVDAAQKEVV